MTEVQQHILEGTIGIYNKSGEMIPCKLFSHEDLNVLIENNDIKIVSNPYKVGDDFFGLVGKKYPSDIKELVSYRKLRVSIGDNVLARALVKCIEL